MHTQTRHSELQRLQLLRMMGVTPYVTRRALPNAAPTPAAFERVEPAPAVSAPPARSPAPVVPSAVSSQEPTAARPRLKQVFETDTPAQAPAPARPQPMSPPVSQQTPSRQPDTTTADDTRFQALLLTASPALGVLVQLPALGRQQLPDRERALLQAILRWLGVPDAELRQPRPFIWPIPGLPGGGPALAGAALRAFVDQARRDLAFGHVLVFGGLLGESLDAAGGLREAVTTYALQELLAVPALKRDTWLALDPLRLSLAAGRG